MTKQAVMEAAPALAVQAGAVQTETGQTETGQTETGQTETGRAAGVEVGRVPGEALIAGELLVEEVSIDGMCGVY